MYVALARNVVMWAMQALKPCPVPLTTLGLQLEPCCSDDPTISRYTDMRADIEQGWKGVGGGIWLAAVLSVRLPFGPGDPTYEPRSLTYTSKFILTHCDECDGKKKRGTVQPAHSTTAPHRTTQENLMFSNGSLMER